MPSGQVVAAEVVEVEDRQAERDEHDDLGEARERRVEPLDLGLVRRADVADQQPGDEDREEARPVERPRPRRRRRRAAASDPDRVEPRARQRDALHQREQQPPADDADREARRPSRRANSRTTTQALAARRDVASSIIPIISAIPTGSFAPDSPSRIVPLRPPTSRLPSTENITAGSVGASAAPSSHEVVQLKSSSECAATATSAAVSERPDDAEHEIGYERAAEPPPPDVHAPVEQDHDQRDDRRRARPSRRRSRARGRGPRRSPPRSAAARAPGPAATA